MTTTFSEKIYLDDVLKWEVNQQYCRKAITVYNRTNGTLSNSSIMMQPLKADESVSGAFQFLLAGEESYCTAFLIDTRSLAIGTLADNASIKTVGLVRGPAFVNKSRLPTTDVNGGSLNLTTLETALLAFDPPVICGTEPSKTVTQTK